MVFLNTQVCFFLNIFTLTRAIANDGNDTFATRAYTYFSYPRERFPIVKKN